jgi:hypothetical protein
MAKKNPKLEFNKKKSLLKNYEVFEKYVLGLDKDFGEILLQQLDTSNNLREDIKNEVHTYITQKISDE